MIAMRAGSVRLLLAAVLLSVATAEPCAGDPSHQVGDTWLCDNRCDMCTCLNDGSISAGGCDNGQNDDAAFEQQFESTVVHLAIGFALVFFVCFLAVCFFMCVKGGNEKASVLVAELEAEDNA